MISGEAPINYYKIQRIHFFYNSSLSPHLNKPEAMISNYLLLHTKVFILRYM